MKKQFLTAVLIAFFIACSDDSSSSTPNDFSVSSIYELGACNSSNRGETKYVQDKNDNYVCIGGEWVGEKQTATPKSSNSLNYADAITSSSNYVEAITSSNSGEKNKGRNQGTCKAGSFRLHYGADYPDHQPNQIRAAKSDGRN